MGTDSGTQVKEGPRPDLLRIVLRNSLAVTAGEWATRVLNFGFTIYAVRLLGEAGFGRYATVVAFVGLFGVFFELGMAQYVQRTIAQDRSKAQSLFWSMVTLRLVLAVLGVVIITSIAMLVGYEQSLVLGVLLYTSTFLLAAFLSPLTTVLTANERFDLWTVLQLLAQALNALAGLTFLQMGFGFLGLLYTGFIVMPVHIALAVWAIRRYHMGPLHFYLKPSAWPAFIRACVPFGLSSVALTYHFNADTVILGLFHSQATVGWYNAAYRLVFNFISITSGFTGVITPSLAREHQGNPERVRKWTRASIQGMVLFSLPISVGVFLLGPQIVRLLYGDAYAPAGPVLSLIIWDVPLMMFNSFCGNITTAVGLERPASRIYLLSTAVGFSLYLLLIPTYGMIAAAGVTVLADSLTAVRFFLLLNKHMEIARVGQKLVQTALAAALMGGVVWLIGTFELPIVVAVGVVIYALLAFWFNLVNRPMLTSVAQRLTQRQ
mgnify:CR=1 FL=1